MFGRQTLDKLPANESQISTQEIFKISLIQHKFNYFNLFFLRKRLSMILIPQNLLLGLYVKLPA